MSFGVSNNLDVSILVYRHVNLSACCLGMCRFSHLRLVRAGRLGLGAAEESHRATLIPDLDVEDYDAGIATFLELRIRQFPNQHCWCLQYRSASQL